MESVFNNISEYVFSKKQDGEEIILNFTGETTSFARMNKSKLRQISDVKQMSLGITLQNDETDCHLSFLLTGDKDIDAARADEAIAKLRERLSESEENPFLIPVVDNGSSNIKNIGDLKDIHELVEIVCQETRDVDLAGIITVGESARGNMNSKGQKHWFSSSSFSVDYSIYSEKEKAVKGFYGGVKFELDKLIEKLAESKNFLSFMEKENKVLDPGQYRCYLAPSAVNELLGTMQWNGLSYAGLQQGYSPFTKENLEKNPLSSKFSLREDFSLALHPRFNGYGEVFAEKFDVFNKGELVELMISSKSAKEYNIKSNNASGRESMRSAVIEPGELANEDVLSTLGTGLYISNLHYLNWSDRSKGRITGMTRFACFWVEDGQIVAPIKDLRFDETVFNFWGKGLEHVTKESSVEMDNSTYSVRSIGGSSCPGMIINDFNFTL